MAGDWGTLDRAIDGEVLPAGSGPFEAVRKPAIARFFDIVPQAIVRCATPADVVETLAFVRAAGLPFAVRSGGHCFAGRSSTRGVVIDVTPMDSVTVSGDTAIIGAGARLADVYDALSRHGLTIPAGCGPTVGVAGLALGGGLGILGRKHGLTSDALLGAQVVLADGRVVDCDDSRDEELFWALRGAGGGNFGVVTSLVFGTIAAPPATSFHLVWPVTRAVDVITAWQGWSPVAPDGLAASLVIKVAGAVDPPTVNVFGTMLDDESRTASLLDALIARVGSDPASAVRRHASHRETKRYLAELFPSDEDADLAHPYSKSEFFTRPLPTDAIAALVEHLTADRLPGQHRELDFSPWGGAYNRVPADATAFVHRNELFLLKHAVVIAPDTATADLDAARRWLTRSWESVRPWGSGRAYQNFPDPDLEEWGLAYYGTNYERLSRVKRKYDPDNVFHFPQSVPADGP